MHASRTTYLHAVKHIFCYLEGTLDYGLGVRPSSSPSLVVAYSVVDWAGCMDSYRSATGYVVFLGPDLIAWPSKKQPSISKSSTKAEYRTIGYTIY